MIKITGLDNLGKQMEEAQKALAELDGKLGDVKFDPNDPESIEAAIQDAYAMVDEKLQSYANNLIIGPLAESVKETYREGILERAATARLRGEDQ